jgi:membrane protein
MKTKDIAHKIFDVLLIRDLIDLKWGRFWVKWTRIFAIAVREFIKDNCSLRASALTFVTLVSIVPVLAFAFSIGKGLGFHEHLKEFLIRKLIGGLGLEGEAGVQQILMVIEKIFDYVDRTNFQTLGVIGTIMLIYLVIRLLGNIERTFNDIWGTVTQRSIIRKFTDYLSIVVVFPLFVLVAATGTAALTSHKFLLMLEKLGSAGIMIKYLLRYTPYLFLWSAFIIIYMVMPNAKVSFISALAGGIIGGSLWQIVQWFYFHFQVSISRYNAIYSTLAALPVFLIWLQLSWMVLLFGAELVFAHQMVRSYRFIESSALIGRRATELVGLNIVCMIARNFIEGKKPLGPRQISESLGISPQFIQPIISSLLKSGIIHTSSDESNSLLLSRAPEKISTFEVLKSISGGSGTEINTSRISPEVYSFIEEIERTIETRYSDHTIADLVSKG